LNVIKKYILTQEDLKIPLYLPIIDIEFEGFKETQVWKIQELSTKFEGIILSGFKKVVDAVPYIKEINKYKVLASKPIILQSQCLDPADIIYGVMNGIDIFETSYGSTSATLHRAFSIDFSSLITALNSKAEKLSREHLEELAKGKTMKIIDVSKIEKSHDEKPIIRGCKCYTCTHHSM
jgi:queuine/archaeosine tRNA-ribosyltransferase